jgi:hypothetical protein
MLPLRAVHRAFVRTCLRSFFKRMCCPLTPPLPHTPTRLQLVASHFRKTWGGEAKGGLADLLQSAMLLEAGGDVGIYAEVDVLQAVQAINLDHARAVKVGGQGSRGFGIGD